MENEKLMKVDHLQKNVLLLEAAPPPPLLLLFLLSPLPLHFEKEIQGQSAVICTTMWFN